MLASVALLAGCTTGGTSPVVDAGATPAPATPEVTATPEPAPATESEPPEPPEAAASGISLTPTLREVAPADFYIGNIASGGGQWGGYWPYLQMPPLREIMETQFNSVTGENQAKWKTMHPNKDNYNFTDMDNMVAFAEENDMRVRGHTLFWHRDLPGWIYSLDDEELKAVLHDHITTVVERYRGQVDQWDVANEIIDDEGNWRSENPWIDRFGPEIVVDVFKWAREADPDAKLYLNDYSAEWDNAKWQKYVEIVPELLAEGAPIDGFGFQGHIDSDSGFPTAFAENMQHMADLGLDVEITELDIRLPVDSDGIASAADQEKQAEWFAEAINLCLAIERCTGVTLWGVGDYFSWVSGEFPGWGSATPFDQQLQPKASFEAIREALAAGRPWGLAAQQPNTAQPPNVLLGGVAEFGGDVTVVRSRAVAVDSEPQAEEPAGGRSIQRAPVNRSHWQAFAVVGHDAANVILPLRGNA